MNPNYAEIQYSVTFAKEMMQYICILSDILEHPELCEANTEIKRIMVL